MPLLINDNVEIARRSGADGVHVGQEDMAAAEVRGILGSDMIVGVTAKTVEQALRIRDAFQKRGVTLHFDSYTNQQFPILTQNQREHFAANYKTSFWQQLEDGRAVVRFCTSWATTDEAVDQLIADIGRM